MAMKINSLEIENVKRVKAVKIEPSESGLTIIGGANNQGKTSVLDAIAWALGGDRYRPSDAQRDGSVLPPRLHVVMNNGLIVERKGKNSDLKITDPSNQRGGQQLLNEFVAQLALDLPKFMQASNKEKATTLLEIIGVGPQLAELERQETEIYNRRHAIGQIADQKKKFAAEMTYYPDAPKELISASDLIRQQQNILVQNGENQRKRDHYQSLLHQAKNLRIEIDRLLTEEAKVLADIAIAEKSIETLRDESTEALEQNISNIEAINIKVRANFDKEKAEEDSLQYQNQYGELTAQLDQIRENKINLLNGASLPLPGISVIDGELTYQGKKWDCMSSSEQLKVSVAIVRKLNPECGFVLMDKLEQMDHQTLKEFGQWLENEGLQVIATRVSIGEECSLIIEDGYSVEPKQEVFFKEGVF